VHEPEHGLIFDLNEYDGAFTAIPRKEWGSGAGVALVLAAGGRATLLDGSPIAFNRPARKQPLGMLAAGRELHLMLLRWLGHRFTIPMQR
jgi:fructose-1,6-bisphosphatase/inositol monophosphatase family enzyme